MKITKTGDEAILNFINRLDLVDYKISLTNEEKDILKKARGICSEAGELLKKARNDVDDMNEFSVAELDLIEIIGDEA
jgi:galactokinase